MGTTTIPEERRYLGKDKLKTVLTKVKEKLAGKVDKVSGKQLSTNDYTTTEKNKLAGIAAGANNYSHPAYTSRTGVPTADAKPGFGGTFQVSQPVSDGQGHVTAVNTRNVTIPNAAATTSAAGLMSSTDKKKLDGIEAGAQKNTVTGIKGNAESSYRTGNVNLTPANIGAAAASHTHAISNITNLQTTLDGKAAKSHTHSASDITDFTTKVKTLQAADILSAEPTETTTTHTVNGVSVAYQIGELVRVPDSKSDTGYKFYQLHAITDGKAMWAEIGTGGGSNIVYSYITIDQGQSGESAMISGDVTGVAIQLIRANSHLYLGKQTASGKQLICQLKDVMGTQYFDGTTAALDGSEGDHWLRLPEFYWKRTEVSGNKTTYGFAYGGRPDSTWNMWDSRQLLGVHEAYVASSKLYSRSGVQSGADITQGTFKTYARNRGTGYYCVTWEWHCMMAMLFYAWYGRMNCQAQCGAGSDIAHRTLGTKDTLGMADTTSSNGNTDNTKFWGLENWWGGKFEFVDNVDVSNYVWTITNVEHGTTRNAGAGCTTSGWSTKMMLSENMDLIPTSVGGSDTTFYCDYYGAASGARIVLRSSHMNVTEGGVNNIYAQDLISAQSTVAGSRLAFIGEIEEAKSVAAYKAATSIG